MKRVIGWIVAVVVALLVLVYVGGGWYFSGQIEKSALVVRHDPPERVLRVQDVARRDITLAVRKGEEAPALATSMVYGISWDGGFGQISGPARKDGSGQVTRDFTMLSGTRPTAGDKVALDRDTFPDTPQVAVPTIREVRYTSGGHSMPAWFAPGRGDTWVVLVHGGLGTERAEALRVMRTTTQLGLPSLAIAYRNDRGTPTDPDHQYRYGATEWRDLEAAVRYAEQHGARHLDLVGYSMGGAITASFLEHSSLAAKVDRVVLDAPALDLSAMVDYGASQFDLPVVGGVPSSLTWTAKRLAGARYDVDWAAIDYLDSVGWLTVPTLVFHGAEDKKVPISTSRTLARKLPRLVTLHAVPNAGHVESWNVDPAGYERTLTEFLR